MAKPFVLTAPDIDPETGHEKSLPDPRPRPDIWRELLASHQVDPNTHLYDIYYKLQFLLKDLLPFVEKELSDQQ